MNAEVLADGVPAALRAYGPLEQITASPRVVVLRGRDPRSEQPVAVKIVGSLDETRSGAERALDRVFNSLAGLKSAAHPSIPKILEVGRIGTGAIFVTSKWAEGRVLSPGLDVDPQVVLNYSTQVIGVLESLARYGLAHLNLRANNLMVDPNGRVLLMGLASGYIVHSSSPHLVAPELSTQLASGGALWRCDLYSLAATTCELLDATVEGPGTQVPFVGLPDQVADSLRGFEGLRLVLESAMHRAATRRPASLGVFRRAVLNCLDDVDDDRPIPLQPLPLEYTSESGGVRVKRRGGPVLIFEASESPSDEVVDLLKTLHTSLRSDDAELEATQAVVAEAESLATEEDLSVEADAAADTAEAPSGSSVTETQELPAMSVDLDSEVAEYFVSAGSAEESTLTSSGPPTDREIGGKIAGNVAAKEPDLLEPLRPETTRPASVTPSETSLAPEADSLKAASTDAVELAVAEDLRDAVLQAGESATTAGGPNEVDVASAPSVQAASEEAIEADSVCTSVVPKGSADDAGASGDPGMASAHLEADQIGAEQIEGFAAAEELLSKDQEMSMSSEASTSQDTTAIDGPSDVQIENEPATAPVPIDSDVVFGRDLVPEELLEGVAAAAEASMQPPQNDELGPVSMEGAVVDDEIVSIELDEGISIGAESGELDLSPSVSSTADGPDMGDDRGVGDVPTMDDLLGGPGQQPPAAGLLEKSDSPSLRLVNGEGGVDLDAETPFDSTTEDAQAFADVIAEPAGEGSTVGVHDLVGANGFEEAKDFESDAPADSSLREPDEVLVLDHTEADAEDRFTEPSDTTLTSSVEETSEASAEASDLSSEADSAESSEHSRLPSEVAAAVSTTFPESSSMPSLEAMAPASGASIAMPMAGSAKAKPPKGSGGTVIRGLLLVAALLWGAFGLLWFKQNRFDVDGQPIQVASAPAATSDEASAALGVPAEPSSDVSADSAENGSSGSELERAPVVSEPAEAGVRAPASDPSQSDSGSVSTPAGDPSPSPGVAASGSVVGEAVARWARSWSSQDVEGYLGSYARSFRPANGASRSQWASYRRDRVTAPTSIEVVVESMEVSIESESRARAVFVQKYSSDTMSDQVRKTLVLVLEDGSWRIHRETSEAV